MLAAAIETMGEVFAVTQKAGIKNADFLELFTTTVFTAPVYKVYGERIAEDNYEDPYLTLPLGLKDATLVAKTAEELNAPLPLASLIRDQMLRAMAQGEEELDWSVIGRVSARSAGL
jgi:3-hydroxyisobutyrate dehydrogenase-like beta-hydroxyacid dehydrogenase